MKQRGEHDFSLSRSHYSDQPVGSGVGGGRGGAQREPNPGPPHQELRVPPTELPSPPFRGAAITNYLRNHILVRIPPGVATIDLHYFPFH